LTLWQAIGYFRFEINYMERRHQYAFTLIELLVAICVLAIILVLFSQMISLVTATWKKGRARVDNFTLARNTLSVIERDIQSMVLRPDLAAFVDENGEPACAFYTCFPAPGGNRNLSLIEYRFTSTPPKMLRRDYSFNYPPTAGPTLTLSNTTHLPDLINATEQSVADGIIGFQIQFLDGDGQFQPDGFQFDYRDPRANTNTRAVILSIIVIDSNAYRLVQATNTLATLLQAFSSQPETGNSYAQHWRELAAANFTPAVPPPVRDALRIFERRVFLPATLVQ
jgi:prepilin-type N-terminal cleavage/methylation domain-containing protein